MHAAWHRSSGGSGRSGIVVAVVLVAVEPVPEVVVTVVVEAGAAVLVVEVVVVVTDVHPRHVRAAARWALGPLIWQSSAQVVVAKASLTARFMSVRKKL